MPSSFHSTLCQRSRPDLALLLTMSLDFTFQKVTFLHSFLLSQVYFFCALVREQCGAGQGRCDPQMRFVGQERALRVGTQMTVRSRSRNSSRKSAAASTVLEAHREFGLVELMGAAQGQGAPSPTAPSTVLEANGAFGLVKILRLRTPPNLTARIHHSIFQNFCLFVQTFYSTT